MEKASSRRCFLERIKRNLKSSRKKRAGKRLKPWQVNVYEAL